MSTADSTRKRRRSSGDLTRERIADAALAMIDADGLDALSMRELGARLEASAMSLYRHFKDKDDLLNAIADRIVASFLPKNGGGTWREQARAMSLAVRRAMLAHPELADLIGREFRRSATSLSVNSRIIARLSEAGVPAAMLAQTYWALSCYTTGHALLEAQALKRRARATAPRLTAADRAAKLTRVLRATEGVDPADVGPAAKVLSRPLDDKQFLFGLDCLLDGIDARFATHTQR